jgi:hypothetical protein
MPPKKITTPGAALHPLDTNQETLPLREAKSQKRKATSPTLQGGVGPGYQGPRNNSPAGAKEKGEDGPADRPSEEDRQSC